MNFKKVFVVVFLILIVVVSVKWGLKQFVFPYAYKDYVDKYSTEYDVDPLLVLAVMKCESNFNEDAQSNKGAKGLMQIMDDTGAWIAEQIEVDDFFSDMLYQPEVNIQLGCWYINNLSEEFKDLNLTLAAYNAGRGNVNKWLGSEEYSKDGKNLDYIPFKETKKYVDKVKTNYSIYKYFYKK